MSIADDLRAAAERMDCRDMVPSIGREYAARLRAHAETIERVEKEMREWGEAFHVAVVDWADALKGETT